MTVAGDWLVHPLVRGLHTDDPAAIRARRELIRRRPFLRRVYNEWYDLIERALPSGEGAVVELGSGCGFLEERLPGLITSDLSFQAPVRLAFDAHVMPFADRSLRAIVMTNVLHHLPDVRRFFREAGRCVRPGGRLLLVEPWVSTLSAGVYGRVHHEPYVPMATTWEFPAGGPLSAANIAMPWMVFARDRAQFHREFPEWRVVQVTPAMPLRYFLSGGVSSRLAMPAWTFPVWTWLDHLLVRWPEWWASFAYVVVERTDQSDAGDHAVQRNEERTRA